MHQTSVNSCSVEAIDDGYNVTHMPENIAFEMDRDMLACNVATFEQSYFPFILSPKDITDCAQLLGDEGLPIEKDTGDLRWRDFPKSPSQLLANEKDVFRPAGPC